MLSRGLAAGFELVKFARGLDAGLQGMKRVLYEVWGKHDEG